MALNSTVTGDDAVILRIVSVFKLLGINAHLHKSCTNIELCLMLVQGGMRAVIWTDVFQAVCMVSGMLTILIKVCFLDSIDVLNCDK